MKKEKKIHFRWGNGSEPLWARKYDKGKGRRKKKKKKLVLVCVCGVCVWLVQTVKVHIGLKKGKAFERWTTCWWRPHLHESPFHEQR